MRGPHLDQKCLVMSLVLYLNLSQCSPQDELGVGACVSDTSNFSIWPRWVNFLSQLFTTKCLFIGV